MSIHIHGRNLYFTIVRSVLHRGITGLVARNPGLSYDHVVTLLSQDLRTLASQYRPNGSPEYSGVIRHLSYVFEYTALNATAFQRAFLHFPEIDRDLKSKTDVGYSICAIGGGPGTELLGMMKLLLTTYGNDNFLINFACLDREESWQHIHNYMKSLVLAMLGFADKQHSLQHQGFHLFDLLNGSEFESVNHICASTDLFVLNYVLSECKDRLDESKEVLWRIVNAAKEGALFLVIDRLENGDFPANVENMLTTLELDILGRTDLAGRVSDQIGVLDKYRLLFDYFPRMNLQKDDGTPTVFAVLATKPEDWIPW